MDHEHVWKSDDLLAWTEHDGPGRAPKAPHRVVWFALSGILAVVFAGLIFSDSLCPEHRAWVQGLGAVALLGTATAIVGLVRGWAGAPVITVISAACGVAIGVIDMAHDPSRGQMVATAFTVVLLGAFFLCVRQLLLTKWEHTAFNQFAADSHDFGDLDVPVGPTTASPSGEDDQHLVPADHRS